MKAFGDIAKRYKNSWIIFAAALIALGGLAQSPLPAAAREEGKISYEEYWLFYDEFRVPGLYLEVVRPFYVQYYYQVEAEKKRLHGRDRSFDRIFVLPPLLDMIWTPRYTNYNFMQIMDVQTIYGTIWNRRQKPRESDIGIYPFFWYGWGEKENENYWAVFPFYGTIKGKVAMDYLHFVAFPVWMEYGFQKMGYKALSLYFPFFLHGRGNNRLELRFFPFLSYSYYDNNYERWSILWPLYFHERNFLYSDSPQTLDILIPVYGRKKQRLSESHLFFWPFFSWGYDATTGEETYSVLWPLVQIADQNDPYMRKRYYFPFYGEYEFRHKWSQYITPFYFAMDSWKEITTTRHSYVVPMFWVHESYKWHQTSQGQSYDKSYQYFKFWPIVHVLKDYEADKTYINMLSPLWMNADMAMDSFYNPLWSLFTYKRIPVKELARQSRWYKKWRESGSGREKAQFRYLSVLFRLYSQWRIGDYFHLQIPLLFQYSSKEDRGYAFSLLHGLVAYDKLSPSDEGIDMRRDLRLNAQGSEDGEGDAQKQADKSSAGEKKGTLRLFWFIEI